MKVIQLNVERDKHKALIAPFLESENADVLCLEEVMEETAVEYAQQFGMHCTFAPQAVLKGWEEGTDGKQWGVAILTHEIHEVLGVHYYRGDGGAVNTLDIANRTHLDVIRETVARVAPVVRVSGEEGICTIAAVHFTYTMDGQPDDIQRESASKLLELLAPYPDLLLCGDFNIPRGNELYEVLASEFTDNIPAEVTSSLDPELHRVPGLELMVDYMWTRGTHQMTDVRVVQGVSDHKAFVGELSIRSK